MGIKERGGIGGGRSVGRARELGSYGGIEGEARRGGRDRSREGIRRDGEGSIDRGNKEGPGGIEGGIEGGELYI